MIIAPKSFLAAGTIGVIYAIDEHHVIKILSSGDFECLAYDRETCVYTRLGYHERIAYFELQQEGLQLERETCLRGILQGVGGSSIPLTFKLQWAEEAADSLAYIHSKGIVHADVGCHNIILDRLGHLKFMDFSDSSIDGKAPLVCYEWCSFQPGSEVGFYTDIFALGSMLFELESWKVPYSELAEDLEMGTLVPTVERLFKFPSVEKLILGNIISGCWRGMYSSMADVQKDIAACIERHMA